MNRRCYKLTRCCKIKQMASRKMKSTPRETEQNQQERASPERHRDRDILLGRGNRLFARSELRSLRLIVPIARRTDEHQLPHCGNGMKKWVHVHFDPGKGSGRRASQ